MCIFLVAKPLYNYKFPSVCPRLRLQGNVIFSAPIQDRSLIFSMNIFLIYEHLFCNYRSISQATKGRNVKKMKHEFLGPCSTR